MPRSFFSPWSFGTTAGATTVSAPSAFSTWIVPAAAVVMASVIAAPSAVSAWTVPTAQVRTELVPSVPILPVAYVELELDGFDGGWTDVSDDVELAFGITIRRGIQGSGPTDLVAESGTARFVLDNAESNSAGLLGYYSPYHANKRTGWALGIGCRVRFQDPATSLIHTRFIGRVDAITPLPGVDGNRTVAVTVTDWMDEAARFKLTPAVGEQVGKRWDEILTAMLALTPRQPTAVDLDPGVEAYPFALDTSSSTGQTFLGECVKLAASEFGPIYLKADGTFKAEGRHARLLHTTEDWGLNDTELQDLSLPSTRDEIINTVRVTIHPRKVDPEATTLVYDQENVITLVAGETKFLLGSFRDPVTGDLIGATAVQPQVAGVDYIANTLPDGSGDPASSLVDIVVQIGPAGASFLVTNNHTADLSLTRNRLYGKAVKDQGQQTFTATDAVSVAAIGEHAVDIDMTYQASADVGQGAADYLLSRYSSAFAQARMIRVLADSTPVLTQMLERDISDRIALEEVVTGLDSSFFINGEQLRLTASGHLEAIYTLAPAYDPFAGLYWILGTSVLGTDTIPAPF